jgi:RHH-type proline utilization regulon transcriptional repressor/proline dehydrogenase/delta 1-pyrroline-5-carboxylate dehydrogenase
MGGKNAIIVTQNAELDETVSGILYSSFMHAGQKCSACSRVIVHNSLKDKLIDRLKEAASDLKVGPAFNFETSVNPIISKEDYNRLCD